MELPGGNWRNGFTGEHFSGELPMENLFRQFPVGLLERVED